MKNKSLKQNETVKRAGFGITLADRFEHQLNKPSRKWHGEEKMLLTDYIVRREKEKAKMSLEIKFGASVEKFKQSLIEAVRAIAKTNKAFNDFHNAVVTVDGVQVKGKVTDVKFEAIPEK